MSTHLNLLLAEDREDDVLLMRQAFNKAGVTSRLQVVEDGAKVLAYLKGEDGYGDRELFPFPDVLLLDVNMPRLNGFEVLEWVRQQSWSKQLMVHVLTASSREADVQRAYELQANTYVVKPSSMDDLIAFVSAFHALHRYVRLPQKPLFWDGRLATQQTNVCAQIP